MRWTLLAMLFCLTSRAAINPTAIPRESTQRFRASGLFEGGEEKRANLESLRLSPHNGFERWVIDFSDDRKMMGSVAPRFQIRYVKADIIPLPDGTDFVKKPARFVFVFRSIAKNSLSNSRLQGLVKKSRFVREIVVYPPVEKGDMAMEFILGEDVLFEPHQPLERQGRLVLDLKTRK